MINFLLTTEIIPLCLRIMETGSELSKTVATFIVQKILLDDMGLQVPLTLSPQPSTLNPQPPTLSPQPSTLNPQPSTLTPEHSTLNLNPQP